MSIKIHHGPPGSYKTSGAIASDLLPALREGRTVVTNVRGLTRERVLEALPEVGEIEIISVDTTHSEGREKLATWFHWVPLGAYIFLDEAQSIWPQSWRDADLRKLDYPGGLEKAKADGRPAKWEDAFDMHRHYNWDMTLTTPDIKKIRADIRGASEGAFKHRNMAMVSGLLKGRYNEGFHAAEDSGQNARDFFTVHNRKIPPIVWKLYDSTSTGQVSDTKAGGELFKSNKILFFVVLLSLCIILVSYLGLPSFWGGKRGGAPAHDPGVVDTPKDRPAAGLIRTRSVPVEQAGTAFYVMPPHPFSGWRLYIDGSGSYGSNAYYFFNVEKDDRSFRVSMSDLRDAGYMVLPRGRCSAVLLYRKKEVMSVTCGARREVVQAESGVVSSPVFSTRAVPPGADFIPQQ